MSGGELALVLATVLCALGFAALVLVLARVVQALGGLATGLRDIEVTLAQLRAERAELAGLVADARHDLARFDELLGSAEAISANVEGASRVARVALSGPVIKTVALASGTRRAASRLRRSPE